MTSSEFYSELAKRTGMSEADSKYYWGQVADLITDAIVAGPIKDGTMVELPDVGRLSARSVMTGVSTRYGTPAVIMYFRQSNELKEKVNRFYRSSCTPEKPPKASPDPDDASLAATIEKNPQLITVLRKIMYAPGPAENRASVTAIKVAVPNNSKPASARGTKSDWRTTPRVCKVCGDLFYPIRKAQDTCCSACTSKKYKQA